MMVNENDRLSQTLDQRNEEISNWKRKYDELDSETGRKNADFDGEIYRLKSDLLRVENGLKGREVRLGELEGVVRVGDKRFKEVQEELWEGRREWDEVRGRLGVVEGEL
jgi:chromosome segregation ATPase